MVAAVLVLPTIFVSERAYYMAIAGELFLLMIFLVHALARGRRRQRLTARLMAPAATRVRPLLCVAAAVLLTAAWFLQRGVLRSGSEIRNQMQELMRMSRFAPSSSVVVVQQHASAETGQLPASDRASESPGKPGEVLADNGSSFRARIESWLLSKDPARGSMWILGARYSWDHHFWIGAGAGTWARFHRSQPRPYREYFAHMHNTYMDLVFEYGVVPMCLLFLVAGIAALRLLLQGWPSRLWILYLAGVAVAALGQNLFYAFTTICLLLPAFLILPVALFKQRQPAKRSSACAAGKAMI